MEVCKHSAECGGAPENERVIVDTAYKTGMISLGQLAKERFAILKDEIAARKKTNLV